VITALGISRKAKTVGYAITEVKGSEVNDVKATNVMNSLSGKVAGLQVSRTASGLGGSSRVVLRGVSSMLGSNKPLFVVDGVPIDVSNMGDGNEWGGRDMGDGLSDINPEDVESISVLKGPAAAAAYGSRGANGVILITTKGGSNKKDFGITISSGYTTETALVTPHLQNEYGLGAYGVYPPINQSGIPSPEYPWTWSFGPPMDGEPRINWLGEEQAYTAQPNNYNEYFRNGSTMSNSIALEGGSEKASTRFSFTDVRSKGLVPNNDLNRQTINLRGVTTIGKIAKVDGKISYIRQRVNNRPVLSESSKNPVTALEYLPRNLRMDDLANNTVDENGIEKTWLSDIFSSNPYWVLENMGTKDEKNRILTSISAEFNFSKNIKLQVRTGFDYYTLKDKSWRANGSKTTYNGYLNLSQRNSIESNTDLLLNINKKLSKRFTVSVNLGGNYRYHQNDNLHGNGSRFGIEDFYNLTNTASSYAYQSFSEKAVASAYGLGTLSFSDYLFLDLSLRNDWSSTLPAENNSYFYHSESLGFIFSDAFNLKNSWFEFGKVRFGYAIVGNDTSPYATEQYYSFSARSVYPIANISNELPFNNLKPETTKGFEVGTNLVFLRGGINLDVTYYQGFSVDQIMSVPLSHFTGYTSKRFNAGIMKGNGAEVALTISPVDPARGFTWNFTLNYSTSNSEVVEIASELDKIVLGTLWSASIQAIAGEEFGIIYGRTYKRDEQGRKLLDDYGYAQTGEIEKLGSIQPDFLGGFHNRMAWKGFNFNFLIDMQVGGEFFSWGKAMRSLFGTTVETLEGRKEWYTTHNPDDNHATPLPGVIPKGYIEKGIIESTGEVNDIPIQPIKKWYNVYAKDIAEEWIIEATNIRMREMLFGYSIDKRKLSRTPFKNVNIAITGRNLFFLYKASPDADPESGFNSGNIGTGFENHALPTTRSFGVNLRLEF
jgi:TonB-linked SusC/RagA family outer membrane protein